MVFTLHGIYYFQRLYRYVFPTDTSLIPKIMSTQIVNRFTSIPLIRNLLVLHDGLQQNMVSRIFIKFNIIKWIVVGKVEKRQSM